MNDHVNDGVNDRVNDHLNDYVNDRVNDRANDHANDGVRTRVAVLVPVMDAESMLDACLDALLETDGGFEAEQAPMMEILVIDDGSRDASVAIARARAAQSAGRVDVLALGRNHGFAGAINRGAACVLAKAQPADVLVLVNQDCIVSRGWLAPLLAALADPAVAVAGARLLDDDGVTLQHAGARIERNGLTSHVGRGSRDPLAWRDACDADYVCGALIAMRTATWRRLGPFDEGYAPAYFEEVDFCVRVRAAGLRVVYVPHSEARHREASCSVAGSRVFLRRYHRSRMRFVVRHLLGGAVATATWIVAEASWLLRLRRWCEIAPVLAAYARVPMWIAELARERARAALGPHSQATVARPARAADAPQARAAVVAERVR